MLRFFYYCILFSSAFALAGCSKDDVKTNPVTKPSQPPSLFSVNVVETGVDYGVIAWSRVKDADLDIIYHKIFLGDILVSSELTSDTSFTIKNLKPLQDYHGYVQATDKKSEPIKVSFSFRTKSKIRVYSRIYPDSVGGDDMVLSDDGGFVSSAGLSKYDSLGNLIFYQRFSPPSYGPNYTDLIQSSDGGYLFCNRFEIQKYDKDGNFLWKSEQAADTLDYYTVYNSIAELPDGGYLSVGNNVKVGGIIQKFNAAGKQVWRKNYDKSAAETMINCTFIRRTQAGEYVVAGSSGIYLDTLAISKIDSEGNIIWVKNYAGGNYVFKAKVFQSSDGSYVVGADTMRPDNSYEARVVNVNDVGDVIWDKLFFPEANDIELYSIVELRSGEYVFVGSQGYYQKSALMIKMSHSGDLILKKLYAPEISVDFQWLFTAVRQTKDGGLLMIGGKGYIYSGTERGPWVLKTDVDGNY